MKSNLLKSFVNLLGERETISAIKTAIALDKSKKIVPITNPVMSFLVEVSSFEDGNIKYNLRKTPNQSEYKLFNFIAHLFEELNAEISLNKNYLDEVRRGVFGNDAGPFYSVLNELITAAYLKSLGKNIKFNSSKESGMPDVEVEDVVFASDAKLFPNNRLQLDAAINESRDVLEQVFKGLKNEVIVIFVFNPNRKSIKSSLIEFSKVFDGKTLNYLDENIHIIPINPEYEGDLQLFNQKNNLLINFQANWSADQPIEKFKESILKSVRQSKKAGKMAGTFSMFPADARRHGIEMTAFRFFGGGHQLVVDNREDIYFILTYSLEYDKKTKQFAAVVDVFELGQNIYGISKDSFLKFLEDSLSVQEVVIK